MACDFCGNVLGDRSVGRLVDSELWGVSRTHRHVSIGTENFEGGAVKPKQFLGVIEADGNGRSQTTC